MELHLYPYLVYLDSSFFPFPSSHFNTSPPPYLQRYCLHFSFYSLSFLLLLLLLPHPYLLSSLMEQINFNMLTSHCWQLMPSHQRVYTWYFTQMHTQLLEILVFYNSSSPWSGTFFPFFLRFELKFLFMV